VPFKIFPKQEKKIQLITTIPLPTITLPTTTLPTTILPTTILPTTTAIKPLTMTMIQQHI
jgi:hypothetical protein